MSDVKFEGHINLFVPPNKLIGWAVDLADPDGQKFDIVVRHAGRVVGRGKADQHRHDLQRFGAGFNAFAFACEEPLPFAAILHGQVTVEVMRGEEQAGALQFDQMTKNIVSALEIGRLLNELSIYDSQTLHATLNHSLPHVPEPVASTLQAAVTVLKNRAEIPSFSKYEAGTFSSLSFKTGMLSSDRAAMLGQEGHLFLVEGNNNVREIFRKRYGQEDAAGFADRWATLIGRRFEFVTARGAAFMQIAIPEKISLMREWLDGHMSSPSATLSALEQRLAAQLKPENYLSALATLSALPYGQTFRKVDSHLIPSAAFAIFRDICRKLGISIVDNIPFDVSVTVNGDLAKRFFGMECYEVCQTAREPMFKAGLKLIASTPSPGGHVGKRYVFRNDQAPIRKKLILFGNSFFDNHVWQGSVSYWLAIWFQEYHFIFTPEMDEAYVEAQKPDIVICQTIERFLELVPAT